MSSRKLITVVFATLFGLSIQAGEFDSEQFWQAPAGKVALVAEMGTSYYIDDTIIINGNLPAENKVTGQVYRPGLLAELGLISSKLGDYSVAVSTHYRAQVENNGVNEPTGIEDAMVALRGRWLVGKYNYSLHYGLRSFFSFGDRVIDQTGTVNSASGGIALEPYVGMQYLFPRLTLGFEASYKNRFDRDVRIEDNILLTSEDATFEDGNQARGTIFAEMPFSRYLLGFRTTFTYQEEESLIRASGSNSENQDFRSLSVGLYGSWDVSNSLVLVPRLEQTFLLEDSLNGREIDTFSLTTLIIQMRFAI